jgi:hypothetical protein
VDTVAEVIKDKANPDRVKYTLELIKVVRINESVKNAEGSTDPEFIIKSEVVHPSGELMFSPTEYQLECQEAHLQAKLQGITWKNIELLARYRPLGRIIESFGRARIVVPQLSAHCWHE